MAGWLTMCSSNRPLEERDLPPQDRRRIGKDANVCGLNPWRDMVFKEWLAIRA